MGGGPDPLQGRAESLNGSVQAPARSGCEGDALAQFRARDQLEAATGWVRMMARPFVVYIRR